LSARLGDARPWDEAKDAALAFRLLQLAAPVLVMLDGEEGSTVRADAAMAVMLGLRLPEVIFGREWKLLRRWRDIGLGVRHR